MASFAFVSSLTVLLPAGLSCSCRATVVCTAVANAKVSQKFRSVSLDLRFGAYIDPPRNRNKGFGLNFPTTPGRSKGLDLMWHAYDLAAAVYDMSRNQPPCKAPGDGRRNGETPVGLNA